MAINAYYALLSRNPRLVREVLDGHESISNFLQVVFQEAVDFVGATRSDIRSLKLRVSILEGKQDQISVHFSLDQNGFDDSGGSMRIGKKILWDKNPLIAHLIAVNDSVGGLACDVVQVLENWTRFHKLSLSDIRIENAWLMCGGTTVLADIITERKFYSQTAKRLGFEDQDVYVEPKHEGDSE